MPFPNQLWHCKPQTSMTAFVPFLAVGVSVIIRSSPLLATVENRYRLPHRPDWNTVIRRRHCSSDIIAQQISPSTSPETMAQGAAARGTMTLFGVPVSNYTARCRYIIYRKGLGDMVKIQSPQDVGGLKGEQFLKFNPLGKMPVLLIGDGKDALFESSVICEFLAESFQNIGPSFIPSSAETRARARTIVTLLDTYMSVLHPYMYKRDVEGPREEGVAKMGAVFDAIEHAIDAKGPYAIGDCLSIADACLWGNFPFYDFMLPTFFNVNVLEGRPKLTRWYNTMTNESHASKDAYNEVFMALQGWWDNERWVKLGIPALRPRPKSSV